MISTIVLAWIVSLGAPALSGTEETEAPEEDVRTVLESHEKARKTFRSRYNAAETDEERDRVVASVPTRSQTARRVLEIVEKSPADRQAFEALRWIFRNLNTGREVNDAVKLLEKRYLEAKELEGIVPYLAPLYSKAAGKLLRKAIEKSPHRGVQGVGRYALALRLVRESRADSLAAEARSAKRREAETWLTEVQAKYADVRYRGESLEKAAGRVLFDLLELSIGEKAPEIEGEDIDGKSMKLSQFRGKVVVLAFWGHW